MKKTFLNSNIIKEFGGMKQEKFSKLQILDAHRDEVRRLKFNMDGSILATGSKDKSIILWSVQIPNINFLHEFIDAHTSSIEDLCWNNQHDLKYLLLSCSDDGVICLWDTRNDSFSKLLNIKSHISSVSTVQWTNDGKYFLSGGLDKMIAIWNPDGTLIRRWQEERILDICVGKLPNNNPCPFIFIACSDGTIRTSKIFPKDYEQDVIPIISDSINTLISALSINESQTLLVAATSSEDIIIIDAINGLLIKTILASIGSTFVIRPTICNYYICCGSENGTITLWDIESGDIVQKILQAHPSSVNDVCFHPLIQTFFVSASDDFSLQTWSRPLQ